MKCTLRGVVDFLFLTHAFSILVNEQSHETIERSFRTRLRLETVQFPSASLLNIAVLTIKWFLTYE